MLTHKQFTAGYVNEITSLTLVLPVTQCEETLLVLPQQDKLIAIFLTGQHRFHGFNVAGNDILKGLLIADIQLEADETTVSSPGRNDLPLGALVRSGTCLGIKGRMDHSYHLAPIAVYAGLPQIHRELEVGFTKWQITLGEGLARKVLFEMNVGPESNSERSEQKSGFQTEVRAGMREPTS